MSDYTRGQDTLWRNKYKIIFFIINFIFFEKGRLLWQPQWTPRFYTTMGGFSFWQAQQRQVTAKRDSVSLRYTGWSKSLYALDLVYWNNPKTIDDSKMAITEHIRTVDRAVLNTVFENTVRRVNKCLETGGGTLWTLLVTFCIVINRRTENFWSPCINTERKNFC